MHFVTKYLSGLKRTVSADNRAPLIIYHQGGEEGEWRILGGGEDLMVSGRREGGSVVANIRIKQKQFIYGSF